MAKKKTISGRLRGITSPSWGANFDTFRSESDHIWWLNTNFANIRAVSPYWNKPVWWWECPSFGKYSYMFWIFLGKTYCRKTMENWFPARFSHLALQGSKIDDSLWKSMGSGHHAHEFQPQTNWALEISPEKCLRTCLLWRRVRRRVTRKVRTGGVTRWSWWPVVLELIWRSGRFGTSIGHL